MHQVELYGILYRSNMKYWIWIENASQRILMQNNVGSDMGEEFIKKEGDIVIIFNFEIKK